jgi:hypothetical protein
LQIFLLRGVGFFGGLWNLLLALANSDLEADHAVVIAQRENRDIAGQVIFRLNDLLRGLRNVRGIGQGEVVLHLLLDGDGGRAGSRRSFRIQPLRINPDVAYPK